MQDKRQQFLEKHPEAVLFTFRKQEFAIYHAGYQQFITGDRYNWRFGLRYEPKLKRIIEEFACEEDLLELIEDHTNVREPHRNRLEAHTSGLCS